jgi:hypothetical protein
LRDNSPLISSYERQTQIDLGRTLFCDDDKRNSGNISINVTDALTSKPLEEVSIAYTCGEDTCVIGKTGANGFLKARFPVCFGGIVSFIKTDYSQVSLPLNINLDESKRITTSLAPSIEKKINLKKKMLEKSGDEWKLNNALVPLDENEEAFIIFNRIQSASDMPYSAFVAVNSTSPVSTAALAPGTYSVDVTIMLNEKVEIPKKWKGIVEIPGMSLNESPSGGLKLNITIAPEQLRKDEITIIALGFDPGRFSSTEDMKVLGLVESYSQQNKNELQPIYS